MPVICWFWHCCDGPIGMHWGVIIDDTVLENANAATDSADDDGYKISELPVEHLMSEWGRGSKHRVGWDLKWQNHTMGYLGTQADSWGIAELGPTNRSLDEIREYVQQEFGCKFRAGQWSQSETVKYEVRASADLIGDSSGSVGNCQTLVQKVAEFCGVDKKKREQLHKTIPDYKGQKDISLMAGMIGDYVPVGICEVTVGTGCAGGKSEFCRGCGHWYCSKHSGEPEGWGPVQIGGHNCFR
mmetsp:Transcript_69114/g.202374  ORF Transcript_69114/g.202374 Transcript_69114/m.202374 type:complete len:242 (+) Transcript_69114:94-819(+)